jgi:hypothetical protein
MMGTGGWSDDDDGKLDFRRVDNDNSISCRRGPKSHVPHHISEKTLPLSTRLDVYYGKATAVPFPRKVCTTN